MTCILKVMLSEAKKHCVEKRGGFVSMNTNQQILKFRDFVTNCSETGNQTHDPMSAAKTLIFIRIK